MHRAVPAAAFRELYWPFDRVVALIHVNVESETEPDICAMARRSTSRSTAVLVLVALVHVGRHGFVVAPFSALRVHSSVCPDAGVSQSKGGSNSKGSGVVNVFSLRFAQISFGQMDWSTMRTPSSMPASWVATSSPMSRTAAFSFKPWSNMRGRSSMEADALLQSISNTADAFMAKEPRQIIDRAPFMEAVKGAIRNKGKLTLVLGGKSVGKTLIFRM